MFAHSRNQLDHPVVGTGSIKSRAPLYQSALPMHTKSPLISQMELHLLQVKPKQEAEGSELKLTLSLCCKGAGIYTRGLQRSRYSVLRHCTQAH